jgi:hypothetical protein
MNADTLHQDMYAYDIYAEYLNKIEHYALNSTINSLSIRYYKQNIPLTKGVHDELDVIDVSGYGRSYDIFDFTPVLQSAPLNYTTENDESNQGVIRKTRGTLTMMAVIEPLPGDIFNFYQHRSTNEFFYVDTVNFVHSVKDLNIYEIQFETSNWSIDDVNEMNIIEHYYYVKEFRKFYDSSLYENYATLLESRNSMIDNFNAGYDCVQSLYTDYVDVNGVLTELSQSQKDKLNSVLLYLNDKVKLKTKIIIDQSIIYNNDLVVKIEEIDCYIPDPTYVAPNIPDPNVPYDPFAGMFISPIMKTVYDLQEIYWSFINYQSPLDGNPDTTGVVTQKQVFTEDAVNIIRDLDGNILPQT